MISKDKIERINELARKKKEGNPLTPAEIAEQKELRQEYLAAVRENLRSQLEIIEIVDPLPEKEYTEEDLTHIAEMTEKLGKEYEATMQGEQALSQGDKDAITEAGNPANPTGEAGRQMVERMNESHGDLTDWALGYFELQADSTVLDVGCGGGAALQKISKLAPEGNLFGLDYSEVSIEAAAELNAEDVESGKLTLVRSSVSDMPFKDESFDRIITVESYYFWPDFETDMQEIFRVLKPGGKFLLVAEMYLADDLDERHLEMARKYNLRNLSAEEFMDTFTATGYKESTIHTMEDTYWICVEGNK